MSVLTDLRVAMRSLGRVKGVVFTVIFTLALGIGANAAIFSLVRGVLLKPLVNDDEDRLIYIRQSAKGRSTENGRVHRMIELFGRLAPGADLESARAELRAAHGARLTEHREDYPPKDDLRIDAVQLRDQITSPARTILLVLLAASGLIFVIACSNVANLILARSVRREGELAVRAANGRGVIALRQALRRASARPVRRFDTVVGGRHPGAGVFACLPSPRSPPRLCCWPAPACW